MERELSPPLPSPPSLALCAGPLDDLHERKSHSLMATTLVCIPHYRSIFYYSQHRMEAADLFIFLGKIFVVLVQFRGLLEACQKLPKAETSQSVIENLL